MFLLLLIISLVFSLQSMDDFSLQRKKISHIMEAEYISHNDLIVRTSTHKRGSRLEDILLYNVSSEKITPLCSGENLKLLCVDCVQNKCVLSNFDEISPAKKKEIWVYDFISTKMQRTEAPVQAPWLACVVNKTGGVIIYDVFESKLAYMMSDIQPTLDQGFCDFLRYSRGTLYSYEPEADMVLSYCNDKKAFYYGSVKKFSENIVSDTFFTHRTTEMHSILSHTVKVPYLIFFSKARESNILGTGQKAHHCNQVSVLNVINRTCTSIDHPELIMALDIHPNKKYLVTLSTDAQLRYIDIIQKKYMYGPIEVGQGGCFARDQFGFGISRLLSFSPDGKFLAIVVGDNLMTKSVPFEVVYGINYKQLMAIMLLLSNVSLHTDIRHLLIFKIINL